jgi:peptide/nickel transport system substrate-binding protein
MRERDQRAPGKVAPRVSRLPRFGLGWRHVGACTGVGDSVRHRRCRAQRRQRLRATLIPAAGALALALLAAACGSSSAGGGGSTSAPSSAQLLVNSPPATHDIGNVNWALSYEPSGLDPARTWDYDANTVLANMCESVVQLTPENQIRPWLATKIDTSSPKKIVLTIRQGVHFWDGHLMTVADVAYSLQRVINPKLGPLLLGFMVNIKSVAVTGPWQVTIFLRHADGLLPKVLAMAAGDVSEKSYVERKGSSYGSAAGGLMCTGPFRFGSWQPGSYITMNRNSKYWNPTLRPKASEVTFRFVTDPSSIVQGLTSGTLDGSYDIPFSGLAGLTSSGAGKMYYGKSTMIYELQVLKNEHGTRSTNPVGDPRIRRALSLLLNRNAIVKTLYHGVGAPVCTLANPPSFGYAYKTFLQGYNSMPCTKQFSGNVAEARALVKQAGSPKQSIVIVPDCTECKEIDDVLAQTAKQVGLNVHVLTLPPTQAVAVSFDTATQKEYHVAIAGPSTWWVDVPDPMIMWTAVGLPGGAGNYSGYNNPTVTKLIYQAYSEKDPTKTASIVNQIQKMMITDDQYWIPVVQLPQVTFMGKRITGAPLSLPQRFYYPWAAQIGGTS